MTFRLALAILALSALAAGPAQAEPGPKDRRMPGFYRVQDCPPGLVRKGWTCQPPGLRDKRHGHDWRHGRDWRHGHDWRHDRDWRRGDDRLRDRDRGGARLVLRIGDPLTGHDWRPLREPHRYGLPPPRDGWGYAVLGDSILRIESDTLRILALVARIMD